MHIGGTMVSVYRREDPGKTPHERSLGEIAWQCISSILCHSSDSWSEVFYWLIQIFSFDNVAVLSLQFIYIHLQVILIIDRFKEQILLSARVFSHYLLSPKLGRVVLHYLLTWHKRQKLGKLCSIKSNSDENFKEFVSFSQTFRH